MFLIWVFNFFK